MSFAIDLNDQPGRYTNEVGDVFAQDMLPSELEARQPPSSQN